jgi:hypothetical protein
MADNVKVQISEKNSVELDFIEEYELIAENIPFDNSSNGFSGTDIQSAIEESGASASPGFSFGKPGNVLAGTWLNRPGNVPSNRAGVTIPINNPVISEISCSNRNIDSYTLQIYTHDGNLVNQTLLGSVTVTSARGGIFTVSFPTTKGKQLAVRLSSSSGTVRDLGADIVIKGSI